MEKNVSGLKMLFVLTGVCLISAAVLGYVHILTVTRIQENKKRVIENAVFEVLPGVTDYKKISSEPVVFEGRKHGEAVGYAVLSKGMGFQGSILLMVGVDLKIERITGVAVLESVETPGLGDKIKGYSFLKQFKGLVLPNFNIKKVDAVTGASSIIKVDSITGATISSIAVEKIVIRAIENVKRIS